MTVNTGISFADGLVETDPESSGVFVNPTFSGTITLSGTVTLSGTLNGGTFTGAAFNGTLGATTPSTAAVTTLDASGAVNFTNAAFNMTSTSSVLTLGSADGANSVSLRYASATNSAVIRIGRDGSASDFDVTNSTNVMFSINNNGANGLARALLSSGVAIPSGGTAGFGYTFSSTANYGVFFGSGAPTLAAAQGSLYLRSDGSGIADRLYVNTNGTTGWTNFVSAT